MARPNLYIHSLFKTGSTYLWGKYKSNPKITAFYEPLHHRLSSVTTDNVAEFEKVDTVKSVINNSQNKADFEVFFGEYMSFVGADAGITGFDDSFILRDFFRVCHDDRFKAYLDMLSRSDRKRKVFQFNRTSARLNWFISHYPADNHIYLLRNPRDQWQSSVKSNFNSVFEVMNYMILNIAELPGELRWLEKYVPMKRHSGLATFESQFPVYRKFTEQLTPEQKYLIHFALWLYGLAEARNWNVPVIDMNELSENEVSRRSLESEMGKKGFPVDLSDIKLPAYDQYRLDADVLSEQEDLVLLNFSRMRAGFDPAVVANGLHKGTSAILDKCDYAAPLPDAPAASNLGLQLEEMLNSVLEAYSQVSAKYEALNRRARKAFFDLNRMTGLKDAAEREIEELRKQTGAKRGRR